MLGSVACARTVCARTVYAFQRARARLPPRFTPCLALIEVLPSVGGRWRWQELLETVCGWCMLVLQERRLIDVGACMNCSTSV